MCLSLRQELEGDSIRERRKRVTETRKSYFLSGTCYGMTTVPALPSGGQEQKVPRH